MEVVITHGSVEFCEATPIGLVDESKESLYECVTGRDLRCAPRHVDASHVFYFIFSERAA